MFDAGKTGMIGLPYGEKNYDDNVKPFSYNTSLSRTDGQTDGRTDRIAISISRVSLLTRDNKTTQLTEIKPSYTFNRNSIKVLSKLITTFGLLNLLITFMLS